MIGILDHIVAVYVHAGHFAVIGGSHNEDGYSHRTALETSGFPTDLTFDLRTVADQKDRMTMAVNVAFVLPNDNGSIAGLLNR